MPKRAATALATVVGVMLAMTSLLSCGSTASDGLAAATDAAERYVNLIATGDAHDLRGLHKLEIPGVDVGDAVKQLAVAKERIAHPTVGKARYVSEKAAPGAAGMTKYVRTRVSYRLDGHTHTSTIVLGLGDGDADDEADWEVLTPMVGELTWTTQGIFGFRPEVDIGGINQTVLDDTDQPLYPGVYAVHARYGSVFVSNPASATVLSKTNSPGPKLSFRPTAKTKRAVNRGVARAFSHCGDEQPEDGSPCPVALGDFDHVAFSRDGWWGGLTVQPRIRIRMASLTLSGGQFRYHAEGGDRLIGFNATGGFSLKGDKEPSVNIDDFFFTATRSS